MGATFSSGVGVMVIPGGDICNRDVGSVGGMSVVCVCIYRAQNVRRRGVKSRYASVTLYVVLGD